MVYINIKNGQILPFNTIIIVYSFQHSAENMLEVFVIQHKYTLYSNAYDDVTNFEICGFHKNTKISVSRERNMFSSNKKIH